MARPRQYETVGELEDICGTYFHECEAKEKFPTVAGLCLALNLTREGLLTYQGRAEFSDTIKRAKLMIHEAVEQKLMSGQNATGAIFNLKNNFGWRDEKTIEQKGEIGVRSVSITGVEPTDS